MGATTQTGQSTQAYPAWLEDAVHGAVDRGVAESNKPLQQFTQADGTPSAVAGFTPDQLQAFQSVRDAQGRWTDPLNSANAAAASAGNLSQVGATSGYLSHLDNLNPTTAAAGYQAQLDAVDPIGVVSPYLAHLDNLNPTASAQPWLSGIANTSVAGSASPLVQAASQSSASQVGDYLNPYNDAVTSRLATLAGRNLSENLLPAVNDTFTRAGQFGSGRNADFTARVLRDTQESLLGQQAQTLQQGYQGALGAAATDAARRAGLAGTVGNLTAADVQRMATGANIDQSAIMNDVSKLNTSANISRQATADDMQRILAGANLGQQSIMNDVSKLGTSAGIASNAVAGDRAGALDQARTLSGLANQVQQQSLTDATAQNQIGATQQALNQQQLTEQQQRFNENRDYGRTTLDWLSGLLRGNPTGSTTTTTAPGANWLSQLGGLGLAAYGLYKKNGGRIPYAYGGYSDDDEDESNDSEMLLGGADYDPEEMSGATSTAQLGSADMPTFSDKPVDINTPLGRAQAFLMKQLDSIGPRMDTARDARRTAAVEALKPSRTDADSFDSRFASPLVQMGLGMAASKSPTLLGGVGEGGLAAAQAAQKRLLTSQTQDLTRRKLALDAAKLEESGVNNELRNISSLARITGGSGKTGALSAQAKLKADLDAGRIDEPTYRAGMAKLNRIPPGPQDQSQRPQSPVAKLKADLDAGRIDEETYKAQLARLTQPIPEPVEKAESQGIGKANAERYNIYQAAGTKARVALDNLDATTALLDQVRAQGAAGPLLKNIQSTLQTFGVDPATINLENAGPAEAADALSSALIMSQLGSLGAGISNADRDFIKSQVLGLSNTREGNTLIAEVLRRQHQRAMEVAKLARDYRKSGGDLAGLDDEIEEKLASRPLFDDSFKEKIATVAKTRTSRRSVADRLKELDAEIARRRQGMP